MAQVDFFNFIPLLFWFMINFLIFYYLNLNFFLPLIFMTLKVKIFYFNFLHDFFYILNISKILNFILLNIKFLDIFNIYILNLIK